MYSAAPQAPVSQDGKNRKTPGTSHSAALERGPSKGSDLFQELMNARAASKSAGAKPAPKAEGLKGDYRLASLLKASRQGAPKGKLPELLPVAGDADVGSAKDKRDLDRKAARTKSLAEAARAGQAAILLDARHLTGNTGKEQKRDSGEPAKLPA